MGRPLSQATLVERHSKSMLLCGTFEFWCKRHLPNGSVNPSIERLEAAYNEVHGNTDIYASAAPETVPEPDNESE